MVIVQSDIASLGLSVVRIKRLVTRQPTFQPDHNSLVSSRLSSASHFTESTMTAANQRNYALKVKKGLPLSSFPNNSVQSEKPQTRRVSVQIEALAERLHAAERKLERLAASSTNTKKCAIDKILPRLVDEYRKLVDDLAQSLSGIVVNRARAELKKLHGKIKFESTPEEIRFWTEDGAIETTLLRAAGQNQLMLVAGA